MMKMKLIRSVCMVVVSALCVGIAAYANPAPVFAVDGQGTAVVMTVNGENVYANEFATYVNSAKYNYESQMAQFGMDVSTLWNDPQMVDSVIQSAKDSVIQYHVVAQQFKKDKLSLNKLEIDEMNDYKQSVVDQLNMYGGENGFAAALEMQGLTEEMYDSSLVLSSYARALNNHYFGVGGVLVPSDAELQKYFSDNYIQAKHILIRIVDDAYQPLPAEQVKEKKALAEEVLAKVQAGEDFDQLIAQYGEDPGMASSPKGYIFTEGEMVDAFYTGAKALADGEISGLVESDYGYHIIKREPLDLSQLDAYRDTLVAGAAGKDFNGLIQEWAGAAEVVTMDEEIAKVTMDTAYDLARSGAAPVAAAATNGTEPQPAS